ncbi:hypothetical protein FACS1894164_16830 [Spirochaetia bacterium]|nr:hypothetical protein FACS1894164_16830 [Spirochaetia bacterium]
MANRSYKDSVFTLLFNDPDKIRELYNAIAGTAYNAGTPVIINTLEDVLFNDRKNDISFLIDDRLVVLIEHQSTINQNMPLRFLLYIARIYEKIVDNRAMYRKFLYKIPRPEFIVLYNGKEEVPDESILKLSKAFKESDEVPLELVVKVLNINRGHNEKLVEQSRDLQDYTIFVDRVGKYEESGGLDQAIIAAIKDCIKKNVLREFLEKHSTEVLNMLTAEFDMDIALEVAREEAREEGMEKSRYEMACKMKKAGFPSEQISMLTGIPVEKLEYSEFFPESTNVEPGKGFSL